MNRILILLFFSFLSFTSISQTKSSVDFTIRNLGINVDGHFNEFSVEAEFDANDKLVSISGKAKVASIKTGIEKRDKHLLEDEYFDLNNHEYIMLSSDEITQSNSSSYKVNANITVKGKTKAIKIPIQVKKTDTFFKITSNFEINRQDFDVGGGSFVMSKTVKINVIHYQKR